MTSSMSPDTPVDLVQSVQGLQAGTLKPADLVRQCLATIATREPQVGAWASLAADEALARAEGAGYAGSAGIPGGAGNPGSEGIPGSAGNAGSASCALGPLGGIPIAVKDIIDVQGMVTGCNSPIYAAHRATRDATIVTRARAAGAIVLGKTTTQEFATRGNMPATRNPHSADHTPGGSSSGSAAAVAAGMVPLALSTQTAGSIVRPASYCGIVGFKPSYGWMPLDGVKTIAPSLDTLGLHTRTVADAWLAFGALKSKDSLTGTESRGDLNPGMDPNAQVDFNPRVDPARRDGYDAIDGLDELRGVVALIDKPLTVGIVRDPYWALAEPATRQALELATTWLRAAGLKVIDLALPTGFERLGFALDTISDAEACVSLAPEWQSHRDQLSTGVKTKITRGLALPQAAVAEAYALAQRCQVHRHLLFETCDFLLTPSAPGYAPLLSAADPGDSSFSKLWTILGTPSVSVPIPLPGPLPIGLEVVCDTGQDITALQCAAAIEAIFFPTRRRLL